MNFLVFIFAVVLEQEINQDQCDFVYFLRSEIKKIWTILRNVIDSFNRNLEDLVSIRFSDIFVECYFRKMFCCMINLMISAGKILLFCHQPGKSQGMLSGAVCVSYVCRCRVVVICTFQLHLRGMKLRSCARSIPGHSVSKVYEIWLNAFLWVNHSTRQLNV